MSGTNPLKFVAGGVAAVVLAFGAYAIGNSNSGNGNAGVANASQPAAMSQAPGGGQMPQSGQVPGNGQAPQNGQAPPGFGTPVTGATSDKVKSAALARYKGTVERVMKLADGSYGVHVITSNGEYHVAVGKDFKVTGAQQGGPGAGAPGGPPPSGQAPQGGAGTSSGTTN